MLQGGGKGRDVGTSSKKGTERRWLLVAAAGGFVVGPLQSVPLGISEHLPYR